MYIIYVYVYTYDFFENFSLGFRMCLFEAWEDIYVYVYEDVYVYVYEDVYV